MRARLLVHVAALKVTASHPQSKTGPGPRGALRTTKTIRVGQSAHLSHRRRHVRLSQPRRRRCTALLAAVPDDHAESPTCTAGFASSLSSVFVPRACTCPTTPSPPPRGTGYGQAPSTRLLENCTLLRLEGPGPQLCPPGQVHKLGPQSLAPTLTAQHHFISATFPKCSHSQMREVQL